jgi:hypothetical protein
LFVALLVGGLRGVSDVFCLLMLVNHSNKEIWAAFVSAGVWDFTCVSSMCACGSFLVPFGATVSADYGWPKWLRYCFFAFLARYLELSRNVCFVGRRYMSGLSQGHVIRLDVCFLLFVFGYGIVR